MTAPSAAAKLVHLIYGYRISQAIHVAATLGIADLLKDGPLTSDALAAAVRAHPATLYRLLRALSAVGVFHEGDGKSFSLTEMSECLRSNANLSIGPLAAYMGRPCYWQAWGSLLHSVQTGDNAFRHVHGVGLWDYHVQHPDEAALFNRGMTGSSVGTFEAIMSAYDFSPFGCVVDVGGGLGAMLAGILAAHPSMRGILFDQPGVVAGAEPILAAAGVFDRCEIVAGSFFETVPSGGDAYLLRGILHDWDDAASVAILKSCRGVLESPGKLVILDRVVGAPNEAPEAKLFDLTMLVGPGGRERTGEEFGALLAEAGFELTRVIPTTSRFRVIEGAPI